MAGILASFGNIGILAASLYPFFIVSFLVLASIFNFNLTGMIYLLGITVTFVVCWLVAATGIAHERPVGALPSCDLFAGVKL